MTQPAAVAETHISYLFFTADKAFKLKKPVRTPFLDFSTVAARRRPADREGAAEVGSVIITTEAFEGVAP